MKLNECPPAAVEQVMPIQEYHPVMEDEEREQARNLRHEQWVRRLLWTGVAGVVALGTLAGWQYWRGGSDRAKQKTEEIAALTEAEKSLQREHAEIEVVVRRILRAKTMDELLPDVAGAAQVKDLMRWYFNHSHAFVSEELKQLTTVVPMNADGQEIRGVQASTPRRPAMSLIMIREEDGWKLEWEMFSHAPVERWRFFLREAPGSPVELPLLAVKKPAPDNYIVKAGASPATHDAVLLQAGDLADVACAVVPRDSPAWEKLKGIGYDDPAKNGTVPVIVRVSLLNPDADPPLIRLEAVVQRGWARRTQKPVAGSAPPH